MRVSTTFSLADGLRQVLRNQSLPPTVSNPKTKSKTKPKKFLNPNFTLPRAAWPIIDRTLFSAIMSAFENKVEEINAKIQEQNIEVRLHNKLVKGMNENGLNEVQKAFYPLIKKELEDFWDKKELHPLVAIAEYNKKADDFNQLYGLIVQKKPMITIKDYTKDIFRVILTMYQYQLGVSTNYLKERLKTSAETDIQRVRTTYRELLNISNNGARSLHCTAKTIFNHLEVMEYHNIIFDKNFHGTKAPISFQFNPEIMAFLDLKTQKISCPDNQYFKCFLKKNLHLINHSITGTINKREIKAMNCQNTSSLPLTDNSSLSRTTLKLNFYRNTSGKVESITEANQGAGENVEKLTEKTAPEPLLCSQVLKNTLTTQQLAENLEKGMYDNYKPLEISYLQAVYSEKSLTNVEFRDFVIQELLKYSAKIWSGKTVYPGTWINAIKHWHENKFLTHDNNPWNQGNILNVYEQHVYRLKEAARFFNSHPQYNPLFPSQYFDVTRTKKHEGGFGYTIKYWEKHLQNLENKPIKATKLKNQEKNRAAQCYFTRKMVTEINNYFKGKTTLSQLKEFSTTLKTEQLKDKFSKMYLDKSKEFNC